MDFNNTSEIKLRKEQRPFLLQSIHNENNFIAFLDKQLELREARMPFLEILPQIFKFICNNCRKMQFM
jgi:hypothetical protein